jgi:hypothetical protein
MTVWDVLTVVLLAAVGGVLAAVIGWDLDKTRGQGGGLPGRPILGHPTPRQGLSLPLGRLRRRLRRP